MCSEPDVAYDSIIAGGFAALVDGKQGLIRLEAVFSAETVTHVKDIQEDLDLALVAEDATFTWDATAPTAPSASSTPKLINEKDKDSDKGPQQSGSAGNSNAAAPASSVNKSNDVNVDDEKRALESTSQTRPQQSPSPQPQAQPKAEATHVFQVRNVTMHIPRGHLVAIVGPVGSGKSSLLQGLVSNVKSSLAFLFCFEITN
jgi:ATP-binding cassette, subfamily C (CFTR/MRP), member 1